MLTQLQQRMEEEADQIKKIIDEIMDGVATVSQMIQEAGHSRSQIAANVGARTQFM